MSSVEDHEQLVLLKGVVRGLELRIEKLEGRTAADDGRDELTLCECGHVKGAHGPAVGCCVYRQGQAPGADRRCSCKQFVPKGG